MPSSKMNAVSTPQSPSGLRCRLDDGVCFQRIAAAQGIPMPGMARPRVGAESGSYMGGGVGMVGMVKQNSSMGGGGGRPPTSKIIFNKVHANHLTPLCCLARNCATPAPVSFPAVRWLRTIVNYCQEAGAPPHLPCSALRSHIDQLERVTKAGVASCLPPSAPETRETWSASRVSETNELEKASATTCVRD